MGGSGGEPPIHAEGRGPSCSGGPPEQIDAVVVGAGHNGLVAACYLAEAGLRVVVLERRDVVGGATVTEELAPGFRVSTASYSLSLLRPDIFERFGLRSHGLVLQPKDPQLFCPQPDGRHFFVWRDSDRTREEIAKISPADAAAYPRWAAFWDEAVRKLRPLFESPDPPGLDGVRDAVGDDVWRLAVAGSAADTVSEFFTSDEVRGAFASQGLVGTKASVRSPGTAWVMAYHALGGELAGLDGTWSYVRGGMGSVSAALAAAARERGTEIRTSVPVRRVVVEGGEVRGVETEDGEVIEARLVLSNAEPRRTFLDLVGESELPADFAGRVREWRTPGCVMKVNMALSEPPDFVALPGSGPQHRGTTEIAPSLEWLEAAYEEAEGGRVSSRPWMEVFMQSAVDDTLAPPGKHVLSAFAQYAPQAAWDPEAALAAVAGTLASFAPNLPGAILASEVLGPPELEERFGLTGGNIFHGEILPEQSFGERFDYRTPVRGLYLCGSGARPGGAVSGVPGRNAAAAVLQDRGR